MNQEEYGRAYQKNYSITKSWLISRGANVDAAEEFAQQGWVQGFRRIGQLRTDASVVYWVNSIALNLYRAAFRRERNRVAFDEVPNSCLSTSTIDFAAIELDMILQTLRPKDRALLTYHHLIGMTAREMAAKEGHVTDISIRVRLLRARRIAHENVTHRNA